MLMRSSIFPITATLALASSLFAVEPVQTLAKIDMPATPASDAMPKVGASALTPDQIAFFETKVRPILSAACYKCHSLAEGKAKGGLTLDTPDGVKKGGDTGAAVVPGNVAKSLLITAITYNDADLQMPPKGEKLKEAEIAALTEWVKMGAPDPRKALDKATKLSGLTDKARLHWAYQPVKTLEQNPPPVIDKNKSWSNLPVDQFILAKLNEKGLPPAPIADRDTLLRRAYFDLLGLPPSPEEIKAFRYDTSPDAWANVVDRLLASPHYGERWGRFWLDTARYSDTIGGDRNANNRGQDYRYPFAWTYRDWVVKAFNQDMPYDKFVIAQLAADRMPETKRDPRLLSAMGFLTVGERFRDMNDVINDRIDTVTKGFLGLTVACARCHDHMFDPIPTKDYYALHGVFSSIEEPDDKPLVNSPSPKQMEEFNQKIAGYEQTNRDEFYRVLGEYSAMFREKAGSYLLAGDLRRDRSQAGLQKLDAIQSAEKLEPNIVLYLGNRGGRMDNPLFSAFAKFAKLAPSDFAVVGPKLCNEIASSGASSIHPIIAAAFKGAKVQTIQEVVAIYNKVFSNLDAPAKAFYRTAATPKSASEEFDFATANLYTAPFAAAPANKLDTEGVRDMIEGWPLQIRNKPKLTFGAINELYITHPGAPAKAMIVKDKSSPKNSNVFIRGQSGTPGDIVPRRFLDILSPGGKSAEFTDGSGRFELAKAIASKDNPLTARVIVNRVWMHHFGEAFVRTLDDLGTQSEPPSHPELLDYLSRYLMDQGWSIKKLHRLIMNSKVYQISSFRNDKSQEIDPYNRLLWRANFRRLDFESMRDSLLVYGGTLDRTVGGQPVNLTDEPYSHRRSVYGYIDRGNMPELLSAFDVSDPSMPNSRRSTTVVPQQALFLMNSSMAVDAARRIIARPEVANAPNGTARVLAIHQIIFQRDPRPSEVPLIYEFLNKEKNLDQFVDAKAKKAALVAGEKKTAEIESKLSNQKESMRDSMFRSIRNEGEIIDRKPLNEWETYAQALLLSNEAAYVN